MTRTAAGVCGVGVILGLQQQQAKAKEGVALRPPGALPEKDFLAACTRCGQCVQACPYDMLYLASLIFPNGSWHTLLYRSGQTLRNVS